MSVNRDYLGRNTWNQAFGRIGDSYTAGKNSLDYNYGQAVSDAYRSSSYAKSQIAGSDLGQGYKQLAMSEADAAMQNAFDSYRSNYLSQMSQLEEGTAKAVGEYNTLLNTQAENQAAYANHAFNYLSYLYENNKDAFSNSAALGRYAVYEDGEIVGVKSIDELQAGMFNPDGTLNEAGIDYINMVQNYGASGNTGQYTFTNYLMEKDPKLLGWLSSPDKYSYGKTNLNSFNDVAGTNSEEYKFDTANLTTEQKQVYYDRYSKVNTEMTAKYESGEYDLDYQKTELQNLIAYAKSLGIYDQVKDYIDRATSNMSTYEEKYDGNEEWAISGAINDYQELYNAIAEKSGQSNYMFLDTQRTVDRAANNDLFETQYNELQSSDLKGIEYHNKATEILKNYGTFSDFDIGRATTGSIMLDYNTSAAGNESVILTYNDDVTYTEQTVGTFVPLIDADGYRIGRVGTTPMIEIDRTFYKLNLKYETTDNKAFWLYLQTFTNVTPH